MKKIGLKIIVLVLILLVCTQTLLPLIGADNSVHAARSYTRYFHGTRGELYKNLKDGETYKQTAEYRYHKVLYSGTIELKDIPECELGKYASDTQLSTNKSGCVAYISGDLQDKVVARKDFHVKNGGVSIKCGKEKRYNATVNVLLSYVTTSRMKVGGNITSNFPKIKIPAKAYFKDGEDVNLKMYDYGPLDYDGDTFDYEIHGTYPDTNTGTSNNVSSSSNVVQEIIQNVQQSYDDYSWNDNNYEYTYVEPAPVDVEKEINLTEDQRRLYIRAIYRRALKREPRGDEYDMFMNGFTIREIASNVILSPECNQKFNINTISYEEFIKCLYRFILGREPDADGLRANTNHLKSTNNKVRSIRTFVESPEFEGLRIKPTKRIELNDANLAKAIFNNLTNQNIEVAMLDSKTLIIFEGSLANITSLDVSGSNVTDLTGISAFTNVKRLSVHNNKITNLSELEKMTGITYLYLNGNNLGDSISSVWKLTNLTELYIDNTGISDKQFNGIVSLKKLKKLTCNKNTLRSLIALRNLPELKEVYASNNNIENLKEISVEKFVADNQVPIESEDVDISIVVLDPVLNARLDKQLGDLVKARTRFNGRYALTISTASLAKVQNLDLSATYDDTEKITDITGLETFRNLKSLDLSNNKVGNLDKLSVLKNLESLTVRNNELTDLNLVKNLKNLKQLDASHNDITNVSGVAELTNLEILLLNSNKIKNNIAPLHNLSNLTVLSLSDNEVSNVKDIKDLKLTAFYAAYNKIDSIQALNTEKLNTLSLKNNNILINVEGNEAELPNIIKSVIEKEGVSKIECKGCTIVDNSKVTLNSGCVSGRVIVKSGDASDTVVNVVNVSEIQPPRVTDVNYEINNSKNQMRVTITTDKDIQNVLGWERAGGRNVIYKDFKYNVSNLNVVLKDEYGNQTNQVIEFSSVVNDKIPGLTITYSDTMPTNQDVNVTISSTEPLHSITDPDWILSSDRKSATKKFTTNTDGAYTVPGVVSEYMFNHQMRPVDVDVQVHNIDKTAPECTIEYSKTDATKGTVLATVWGNEEIELAENNSNFVEKTTKLNENGKTVYGISLLYSINENLNVNVKDAAGNTTSVEVSINNIDNILDGLKLIATCITATNVNQLIKINANEKITMSTAKNTIARRGFDIAKQMYESSSDLPIFKVATTTPIIYLAETEIPVTMSENQISIETAEGDYGVLDVSDNVGNTELAMYDTNNIDKTAPILVVENRETQNDGSIKVTIVSNEEIQKTDDLNGWVLSEDGLRISKIFKSSKYEKVAVKDLAGNEGYLDLEVEDVDAIKYSVDYELIENTDSVLVIIRADREIKEPDGWRLLEDKKSIAKALKVDQSEIVYIEDNDGFGTKVNVEAYEELEKNAREAQAQEDNTQTTEKIPQTGRNTAVIVAICAVPVALGSMALKKSRKKSSKK